MDQKTREHYRHAVRDVKTAVFVAAWVQEMFDVLDGEIDQRDQVINRIRDYCRTTPLDDLDPYTILRMIDGEASP
jgi:hypothetical protein